MTTDFHSDDIADVFGSVTGRVTHPDALADAISRAGPRDGLDEKLPSPRPQMMWVVSAEFTDRDDAVALMDLARELGVVTKMTSHAINTSNERPAREWRLGKLILGSMVPGRSYDSEHFRALLAVHGFAPASYSPTLSLLVRQGDVERVGSGVFQLRVSPCLVKCKQCTTPVLCDRAGFCRLDGTLTTTDV